MANSQIQTGSSLGVGSVRNADGTITVRCRICGNAITDVDGRNKFHSAECIVCQYEAKGELLPADIEDMLRTIRTTTGNRIPIAVAQPQPILDPMIGNEPKVGRPEYVRRVIRQSIQKTVEAVGDIIQPKRKKYKEQTAQELADSKRHKPLFTGGIEINIKERE